MPAPTHTLLIEGAFEELAEELAQYIDDIQKKQNPEASSIKSDIGPLLEQGKKDDALKKLVTGSATLNHAPERGKLYFLSLESSPRSRIVPYRIYRSLQSPRPSRRSVPQRQHLPPQNDPKPLQSHPILTQQRSWPLPLRP